MLQAQKQAAAMVSPRHKGGLYGFRSNHSLFCRKLPDQ